MLLTLQVLLTTSVCVESYDYDLCLTGAPCVCEHNVGSAAWLTIRHPEVMRQNLTRKQQMLLFSDTITLLGAGELTEFTVTTVVKRFRQGFGDLLCTVVPLDLTLPCNHDCYMMEA